MTNPFVATGEIPDKYFCDREKETETLITYVTNGNNVVLMSPRRLGKTSLVEHCYNKKAIKDHYYTFYVDILPTTSLAEFTALLSKHIYSSLLPLGKKILGKFLQKVSSLQTCLGFDAISGMPTLTLSSAALPDPVLTLEEIFRYLAEADKPCIVTIDEFQQIGKYPEKNVEAFLRSHIQKLRNCNFIFAGSERHLMMRMFFDSSRPFYNSASTLDLRAIPMEVYTDFAVRNFREFSKEISRKEVQYGYELLYGNTCYVQRLFNQAFALTPEGTECTRHIIQKSLETLLYANDSFFRERLSLVPPKQKELLYAVAQEGEARNILSAQFMGRHNLLTSSQVQYAAKVLVETGLLNKTEGVYTLADPLLSLWIRKNIL